MMPPAVRIIFNPRKQVERPADKLVDMKYNSKDRMLTLTLLQVGTSQRTHFPLKAIPLIETLPDGREEAIGFPEWQRRQFVQDMRRSFVAGSEILWRAYATMVAPASADQWVIPRMMWNRAECVWELRNSD